MTYQARVEEIAGLVSGLSSAGKVHARTRLATNWKAFILLFKHTDNRINGWEISRASVNTDTIDAHEKYVLRRYFGIKDDDATDFLFQESLDDVLRLFRDTPALSFGSIPGYLEITTIEEREFGNVLCHYAECELVVSTEIDLL